MTKTIRDNATILGTYIIAIGIGLAVAAAVWDSMPRWAAVLTADLVATIAVFGISRTLNNSSVYDAYWSVAPPVIAFGLFGVSDVGSSPRAWLASLLLTAWGARLTYNWWRGWTGMGHEDWRYVDLRKSMGRLYWLVSFAGLHLFPTLLVYAGCMALLPVMDPAARRLGLLDLAATAVMLAAIVIEAVADQQLHEFVASKPQPDEVMTRGLWGRCRHPNYLGELSLWYGLALFGLAADPSAWWVGLGPLVMTALFVFISIPMIEKRMLRKRPGYADVIAHYPKLLPLGRR